MRRYLTHLSTGNYNDRTAKLYSDLGLLTSDSDLTADAAAFFNLLTGYSQAVGWKKLTIAPTGLRQRFLDLIDREIQASSPDRPGLIMAKVNSLQDRKICRALYEASRAGVRVQLNVRGICCLRPGVPRRVGRHRTGCRSWTATSSTRESSTSATAVTKKSTWAAPTGCRATSTAGWRLCSPSRNRRSRSG